MTEKSYPLLLRLARRMCPHDYEVIRVKRTPGKTIRFLKCSICQKEIETDSRIISEALSQDEYILNRVDKAKRKKLKADEKRKNRTKIRRKTSE